MIHEPCPLYPPRALVTGCWVETVDCAGFVRAYLCDSPTDAIVAAHTFLVKRWSVCLFRSLANAAETALSHEKLYPLYDEPSPLHSPSAEVHPNLNRWAVQTTNCAGMTGWAKTFDSKVDAFVWADRWLWNRRFELLFRGIANCAIYTFRAVEGTSAAVSKTTPSKE